MEERPPRLPVEAGELADVFLAMSEGGFILSKTLEEPTLVA